MATTIAKQNGTAKKETTVVKKQVQKKLAEEATGKKETPISPQQPKQNVQPETPIVNLDDRMQKFEQLKGLAHQRTRLFDTLTDLNKFKYNQSDSATIFIKDSYGLEFKTTNTNLIHLLTNYLKNTLDVRKEEIEKKLIAFEL